MDRPSICHHLISSLVIWLQQLGPDTPNDSIECTSRASLVFPMTKLRLLGMVVDLGKYSRMKVKGSAF